MGSRGGQKDKVIKSKIGHLRNMSNEETKMAKNKPR